MTTPPKPPIRGLYVIVDPEQTRGRDAVEVARQALEGGASLIQWRDKARDKGEQLPQLRAVRAFVPADFIVGVSTNNVEEARRAQAEGASYVAVGALFPTASKSVTRPASPQRLQEVKQAVSVPVVGIGGINEGNIDQVLAAGADAVAVISAVIAADDVREAAARLAAHFGRATE